MSNMKNLYLEVSEELGGLSPEQLLKEHTKMLDKEWEDHKTIHRIKPDNSCPFCNQDADEIQDQEFRWGDERMEEEDAL